MKIIIEYKDTLDIQKVLESVYSVMLKGKISEANNIKQYCFHTTFHDKYNVQYPARNNNSKSDKFVIS